MGKKAATTAFSFLIRELCRMLLDDVIESFTGAILIVLAQSFPGPLWPRK